MIRAHILFFLCLWSLHAFGGVPIRFSLSDINTGLGVSTGISNAPVRLDVMEAWSGDLDDSGFTLGAVNAALGTARSMSNTVDLISSMELRCSKFIVWEKTERPYLTSGDPFLGTEQRTLDLSDYVGNREAVVMLYAQHDAAGYDTPNTWVVTCRACPKDDTAPNSGVGFGSFSKYMYQEDLGARSIPLICMTDDSGQVDVWVDQPVSPNVSSVHFYLKAYLINRVVELMDAWKLLNGVAVWFDGVGAVNASGAPIDSHTKPTLESGAAWPDSPATGDWTFSTKYGCPAWFDGVGWINFSGAPLDGHVRPAPNGSYSRSEYVLEGDMELDEALWLPIFRSGGAWINATGAEV